MMFYGQGTNAIYVYSHLVGLLGRLELMVQVVHLLQLLFV